MHKALRSAVPPPPSLSYPPRLSNRIINFTKPLNCAIIRLAQSESEAPPHQMDPSDKQPTHPAESKTPDTMSSFGEGYATRSDEEGFGGIYGGNQYVSKKTDHHAAEFDDTQGSEVKEKEKARNQEKVAPRDV